MKNDIQISVILLTYQHADYIEEAVESILMQKVNFKYEVIAADDCSTDGTQEILKQYGQKYPDTFRLYLRDSNVGATQNFTKAFLKCTGRYFITLEGDDYWTDEKKLQKQFDFLENHKEYSAVAHPCRFVDEAGNDIEKLNKKNWFCTDQICTMKHLERGIMPGQTTTILYRSLKEPMLGDYSIFWKADRLIGDKTVMAIALSIGDIYCLGEVMSVYRRVEKKGNVNAMSQLIAKNNCYRICRYLKRVERYITKKFGKRHIFDYYIYCEVKKSIESVKRNRNFTDLVILIKILGYPGNITACLRQKRKKNER